MKLDDAHFLQEMSKRHFKIYLLVGWLVVLRINVDLAIF